MNKHKESGVNIDLGNQCSRIAYNWAKSTFINRKNKAGDLEKGIDGAFSNVLNYNGVRLGITSDGIGTKIELAERTGIYDTLGFDLVAMVVDDLAANGFEAASLSNILDVDYLDADIVDDLMRGLAQAAKIAGIAVPGGEIAELGNRIGGWGERMHFNWCSTAVGILPPELEQPVAGQNIKPGDSIISLASRGFRSNGFSLIRRVMQEKQGELWHQVPYDDKHNWGEMLLTPCHIYNPLINWLIRSEMQLKGIAHITGGGLADNLSRVLKVQRWGAKLDNIFHPLEFMLKVMEMGKISEEQAYLIWNMGNGMLLVVDPADEIETLELIEKFGMKARLAGRIISERKVILQTRGLQPQKLVYEF
ncbi:MAG: phosphoribosylformylglycinamidine cyclo-ligase [Candidatus Cloacimonetes bacterium]|nr:phosphoribosylformylglycinamidine cyclo-ligase [Candidatus Cloacimonadota bacterium]